MAEKRLSIKKDIRQRGEEIISDTDKIIDKLAELESFAKARGHPYLHFYVFHNELKVFASQFERMLR